MQSISKFVKDTIVGGLLFMVPLFVLIILGQKIWTKMTGVGEKLSALLGIKFAGASTAPLMTSLLIILICFAGGLLFRLSFISAIRDQLDKLLVKYIPGYEFYKVNLERKIRKDDELLQRPVALVLLEGIAKPCMIVEEVPDQKKVVFVPADTGSKEGQVLIVPDSALSPLNMDEKALKHILLHQGKGLKEFIK